MQLLCLQSYGVDVQPKTRRTVEVAVFVELVHQNSGSGELTTHTRTMRVDLPTCGSTAYLTGNVNGRPGHPIPVLITLSELPQSSRQLHDNASNPWE